ncbi:catalase [Kordiimonas aestuarii]|uniref:hypothetical protein n=1 Tax=Kordiimonas aestuarii TaxID=1005925 RepID=UPI0021CF1457|nr:hypothetical protein [Kordiimonas aestuarii]
MYGEFDNYRFRDARDALKSEIWSKAGRIAGHDPDIYRRDSCGRTIRFMDHGKLGQFGWKIDTILPLARGGSTDNFNLQPLHWENHQIKRQHILWMPEFGVSDTQLAS